MPIFPILALLLLPKSPFANTSFGNFEHMPPGIERIEKIDDSFRLAFSKNFNGYSAAMINRMIYLRTLDCKNHVSRCLNVRSWIEWSCVDDNERLSTSIEHIWRSVFANVSEAQHVNAIAAQMPLCKGKGVASKIALNSHLWSSANKLEMKTQKQSAEKALFDIFQNFKPSYKINYKHIEDLIRPLREFPIPVPFLKTLGDALAKSLVKAQEEGEDKYALSTGLNFIIQVWFDAGFAQPVVTLVEQFDNSETAKSLGQVLLGYKCQAWVKMGHFAKCESLEKIATNPLLFAEIAQSYIMKGEPAKGLEIIENTLKNQAAIPLELQIRFYIMKSFTESFLNKWKDAQASLDHVKGLIKIAPGSALDTYMKVARTVLLAKQDLFSEGLKEAAQIRKVLQKTYQSPNKAELEFEIIALSLSLKAKDSANTRTSLNRIKRNLVNDDSQIFFRKVGEIVDEVLAGKNPEKLLQELKAVRGEKALYFKEFSKSIEMYMSKEINSPKQ